MTVTVRHALLAAHEAGHAVARVALGLGVGSIVLRESGAGSTERRPQINLVAFAEARTDHDGLSALSRELIACHAGHVAEERWHEEEIGLRSRLPQSSGDAEAVRYLLTRFPGQVTPAMRRETEAMAYALVNSHWGAVKRLVRVLCAHCLPVRLHGQAVRRVIEDVR